MTDPRLQPDEERRLREEEERSRREQRSRTDIEREITAERELPPDRRYRHRAIERSASSSPPHARRELRTGDSADRTPLDRPAADPGHAADHAVATDIEALRRTAAERQLARERAVHETEPETSRGLVIASRVVNFVFSVIYALLGLRLLLGILGANPNATFAQWVTQASEPLHAPFRGLFPNVTIEDGFTFALSVAFAILVYALAHALIQGALRIAGPRVA